MTRNNSQHEIGTETWLAEMIALGASADVMGIGLKKIDSALQREIWDE